MDGFRTAAEAYLNRLRYEGKSGKTLEGYSYALRRAHEALLPLGRVPAPRRLTEVHVRTLERLASPHLVRDISTCLSGMGCPIPVRYRIPPRRNVRWLSLEDANLVMDVAYQIGPPQSTAVYLMLGLGFRRVSVCRAWRSDFDSSPLLVRGKPSPRKDYTIMPGEDLPGILTEADRWRTENGLDGVPWLVPSQGGKLRRQGPRPYSESGMDGVLGRVSRESGVRFSAHDLRRTFGRHLWEALGRKDLETVSAQMGHSSTEQTRDYLGINLDDRAQAMKALTLFRKNPVLSIARDERARRESNPSPHLNL